MKERTNFAEEEDTEEMKRWRSLNQIEMDLMLEEVGGENGGGSPGQVQSRREQERCLFKAEITPWNGEEHAKTRHIKLESGKKIAGRDFSLCLENTTCSVCKASWRS